MLDNMLLIMNIFMNFVDNVGKYTMKLFNILKKLIPHIMKVGGSVYLLQNGMDDSPMCGNEFPGNFFRPNPNQLTC